MTFLVSLSGSKPRESKNYTLLTLLASTHNIEFGTSYVFRKIEDTEQLFSTIWYVKTG